MKIGVIVGVFILLIVLFFAKCSSVQSDGPKGSKSSQESSAEASPGDKENAVYNPTPRVKMKKDKRLRQEQVQPEFSHLPRIIHYPVQEGYKPLVDGPKSLE